jgi:hypothetical protein
LDTTVVAVSRYLIARKVSVDTKKYLLGRHLRKLRRAVAVTLYRFQGVAATKRFA